MLIIAKSFRLTSPRIHHFVEELDARLQNIKLTGNTTNVLSPKFFRLSLKMIIFDSSARRVLPG